MVIRHPGLAAQVIGELPRCVLGEGDGDVGLRAARSGVRLPGSGAAQFLPRLPQVPHIEAWHGSFELALQAYPPAHVEGDQIRQRIQHRIFLRVTVEGGQCLQQGRCSLPCGSHGITC